MREVFQQRQWRAGGVEGGVRVAGEGAEGTLWSSCFHSWVDDGHQGQDEARAEKDNEHGFDSVRHEAVEEGSGTCCCIGERGQNLDESRNRVQLLECLSEVLSQGNARRKAAAVHVPLGLPSRQDWEESCDKVLDDI